MSEPSDANPGLLWRLDIKDRDGRSIKGYPRIFASDTEYIHRLGYWMNKNYEKNLGLTFIKEGCTRTPWLNLDGPAAEDPDLPSIQVRRGGIRHPLPDGADGAWKAAHGGDDPKPEVLVFYEAA